MTYITLAESKILLEKAKDTRLYMAILLELSTGLRRGELLGLRWQDLDLTDKTLCVKQSIIVNYAKKKNSNEDNFLVSTPKTKRSKRNIPIINDVIEELKKHKIRQN
jgi:integrase